MQMGRTDEQIVSLLFCRGRGERISASIMTLT